MTVIAAITDGEHVYMAADRLSTTENGSMYDLGDPKVVSHLNGKMVIGATGVHRMLTVLRYAWNPPQRGPYESVDEYMFRVVDSIERFCKGDDVMWGALRDNEQEGLLDARLLIGYAGRIWVVSTDFGFGCIQGGYGAVGSGQAHAEGAFYALSGTGIEPAEAVVIAVRAAIKHMAGLGLPIDVVVV